MRETEGQQSLEQQKLIRLTEIEHAAQIALNPDIPKEERQKQFDWLKEKVMECTRAIGVLEQVEPKNPLTSEQIVLENQIRERLFKLLAQITSQSSE